MSQLPMIGELSTELAQREHAARYLSVRAALREEAKSAAAVSQSGGSLRAGVLGPMVKSIAAQSVNRLVGLF